MAFSGESFLKKGKNLVERGVIAVDQLVMNNKITITTALALLFTINNAQAKGESPKGIEEFKQEITNLSGNEWRKSEKPEQDLIIAFLKEEYGNDDRKLQDIDGGGDEDEASPENLLGATDFPDKINTGGHTIYLPAESVTSGNFIIFDNPANLLEISVDGGSTWVQAGVFAEVPTPSMGLQIRGLASGIDTFNEFDSNWNYLGISGIEVLTPAVTMTLSDPDATEGTPDYSYFNIERTAGANSESFTFYLNILGIGVNPLSDADITFEFKDKNGIRAPVPDPAVVTLPAGEDFLEVRGVPVNDGVPEPTETGDVEITASSGTNLDLLIENTHVEQNVFDLEPLPLTITDFSSYLKDGKPLLSWSIQSSENVGSSWMERSPDGVNFESVGVLPTSVGMHEFHHKNADNGINYYRIASQDIGKNDTNYSKIVSADVGQIGDIKIQGPNIIKDELVLDLASYTSSELSVNIFSITGIKFPVEMLGNTLYLKFLPVGTYLLSISTKGKHINPIPFVIAR